MVVALYNYLQLAYMWDLMCNYIAINFMEWHV
jgi:hypothetical protein